MENFYPLEVDFRPSYLHLWIQNGLTIVIVIRLFRSFSLISTTGNLFSHGS